MAARNASTEKTELAGISCRLSKKRSPRSPNTPRSARARFVGGPVWRLLADESHRCIRAVGSTDDDDCGIRHPTLPSQTARTKPWRIPSCGAAFHAFCGRSCATGRPSRKACPELVEGCFGRARKRAPSPWEFSAVERRHTLCGRLAPLPEKSLSHEYTDGTRQHQVGKRGPREAPLLRFVRCLATQGSVCRQPTTDPCQLSFRWKGFELPSRVD